jgi:hypothetical protein
MSDLRRLISWLLLVLVAVVGGGAAVVGVLQSPNNVALKEAVTNTLAAPNYSQVVTESTPQGKQTDYLVYQAPDRLGGYVQSGNKRTYVYVIGTEEYQSLTVAANTSTKHLTFYKQQSEAAADLDPAHNYLHYATTAKHVTNSGNMYTFKLTESGQTGTFVYTVSGKYISEFSLTVKGSSVQLVISQVGSSPPVALPVGAKVVKAPTSPSG